MSQLTQFLVDTAAFHRRHKTVAALATLPHRFSDLPEFAVIAALVGAHAFYDGRVYVAQIFNCVNVASRMVDYLFIAIPLVVFWLAIGCFFFAPDFFAEALAAIQEVTPTQVVGAIPVLAQVLVVVSFLVLGAHSVIGLRFGFVNQFGQAVRLRVRRAMACVADGEVWLYRIENGTFVASDEWATIRTKQ